MVAYEPIDSEVEVNGQTVLSVINAFPEILTSRGERMLADNGIENPEADEWYPQEDWLDTFADIHESMGESTLERIGQTLPETAEWPPGTDTIVAGVESIDTAYQMNHRGGEIGNYDAERIDDTRIHVTCTNPYPCAFDTGILKGVVEAFGDERTRVREIGSDCRAEGDDNCLHEIEW